MLTPACEPKPYIEYWPGRVSQAHVPLQVNFVGSSDTISVGPPENTVAVQAQKDYDPKAALKEGEYGPTKAGPIGHVVHARSGVSFEAIIIGCHPLTPSGQGRKYV